MIPLVGCLGAAAEQLAIFLALSHFVFLKDVAAGSRSMKMVYEHDGAVALVQLGVDEKLAVG